MRRPRDCCTRCRRTREESSLHCLFSLPLFVSHDSKMEGTILNKVQETDETN